MYQIKFFKKMLVLFKQWTKKPYGAFNSLTHTIKICTLAVSYSLVCKPIEAQTTDTVFTTDTPLEIDEVVVQSSPVRQTILETGRQIQVINSKEIELKGASSIEELISQLAGIENQSRNGFGVQTDFSLRGSTFQQVLILIDGQRINDPMTAHFNGNIPVSISEIHQIEIIQGPVSADFGPDATGGAINIITKTFSSSLLNQGLNTSASLKAGSYGFFSGNGGINYKTEFFNLGISAQKNISNGQKFDTLAPTRFDIETLSIGASMNLNKNLKISLRLATDIRDFNAQYFYSFSKRDSATEKVERYLGHFQTDFTSRLGKTKLSTSYLKTNDYYVFNPSIKTLPAYINDIYVYNFNLNHTIDFGVLNFHLGVNSNFRDIKSNNRGNHTLAHYGGFFSTQYKPIDQLTINVSLRQDYDEQYQWATLPQWSFSWRVTETFNTRYAAGRSVRAADFTELYYQRYGFDTLKRLPAGNKIGNPNLEPEDSWSNEIGFDWLAINGLTATFTGFYRSSKNLIDYVSIQSNNITDLNFLNPNSTYFVADNLAVTNTYGINCEVNFKKPITNLIQLNYLLTTTFQETENKEGVVSFYIANHAKQKIYNSIIFNIARTSIGINNLYILRDSHSTTELNSNFKFIQIKKDYSLWNFHSEYTLYKNRIWINLQINNVFDTRYMAILGPLMPGRWLMLGARFSI